MYRLTAKEDATIKSIIKKYLDLLKDSTIEEAKQLREAWSQEQDPIIAAAIERTFKSYKGNIQAMLDDLKPEIVRYGLWYGDHRIDFEEPISYWTNEIQKEHQIYFDFIRTTSPKDFEELTNFIVELLNNPEPFQYYLNVKPKNISTSFPKTYIRPLDRMTSNTFSGMITEELQPFKMEGDGQREITTYSKIIYEGLEGIRISNKNFNAFDRSVYDAIVTLYHDGNQYVSNQMIYQVMTANPKARMSTRKAEEITNSIERCMSSIMYIDAKEEIDKGKYQHTKPVYFENLLTAKGIMATINGSRISCIEVSSPPVLYEYAKAKKQLGSCKLELLNTPVNKTDEVLAIQDYLLGRIMPLKNKTNTFNNRDVLYQNIYDLLNLPSDPSTRNKKKVIRELVERILDHWITENYITGYEIIKKGREIYKIRLNLD